MQTIAIAADHGGFELKEQLKNYLGSFSDVQILDLGAKEYNAWDDYPDFAVLAAQSIVGKQAVKAILVCGSGVGACVTANKFKGVRACVCHDTYSAHQGVEHDDMNVLCLGGRIIGIEVAKEILYKFVNAKFSSQERHVRRLNKVLELEKESIR